MAVDNTFTMKKLQSLTTLYAVFSRITRMPYVECDPETFDDQVHVFSDAENAKAFVNGYEEQNIPVMTMQVNQKQMPNFYSSLYAISINSIIFHDGIGANRLELEKVIVKPDMEKMQKEKIPVMNPGLQLTAIYFLQEIRRPNQPADDTERMRRVQALEEEMIANLARSRFIVSFEVTENEKETDPAKKRNVRVPYVQNKNGDMYQPLFSDIGEFQKFHRDPKVRISLRAVPFKQLISVLMPKAKGFVLNPIGFNLVLSREQMERIAQHFGQEA